MCVRVGELEGGTYFLKVSTAEAAIEAVKCDVVS